MLFLKSETELRKYRRIKVSVTSDRKVQKGLSVEVTVGQRSG